jgi:hypothetical protein
MRQPLYRFRTLSAGIVRGELAASCDSGRLRVLQGFAVGFGGEELGRVT